MGNIQGQFSVGSYYNITAGAPLDVRTLVKKETDLTAEDSWNSKTHPVYKGMMVTVQETGNVYTLIDVDNVHSIDGWKKVGSDSDLIPFEKGDADNSAVLKGEYDGYSNKAISQTSMAVGAATTAGLKGWYYSAIDFTNNIITLSDKQPLPIAGKLVMGDWKSGTPNISVGDKVSIVNNSKYDYCGEVKSISGNKVTLKSALPFDTLDVGNIPVNNPDDWTIYLPDKPDAGIIDFGGGALAEGVNTKSTNIGSHAEGIQTHAYGQYSHTEGFKTKAGYAAHAEGRETNAKGEQSHTEGRNSTASGNCSHAEGRNSIASGHCSHAEGINTVSSGANSHAEGEGMTDEGITSLLVGAHGRSSHVEGIATTTGEYNEQTGVWSKGDAAHAEGNNTIASGNHSHAEGSGTQASGWQAHAEGHNTLAKGNRSHAEGSGTEAYNLAEHAQGSFNKSTESTDKSKATQFSIGIGTSDDDRKNAVEIKQDGKHYIYGVGGYDGTNPDSSEDLATVLSNRSDANGGGMTNVTYSELIELRNNSQLIAGMQYRITDYVTTTIQENTLSAGHQFDIIVTADDENTLNEVARACKTEFNLEKYKDAFSGSWDEHMSYVGIYEYEGKEYHLYESEAQDLQMLMDFNSLNILENERLEQDYRYEFYPAYGRYKEESWGEWLTGQEFGEIIDFKYNLAEDTYFFGSNLAAWKIWYCLDNDTVRFKWAAPTDGKTKKVALVKYGYSDYTAFRDASKDTEVNGKKLYAWNQGGGPSQIGYSDTLDITSESKVYTSSGVEDTSASFLVEVKDIEKGKGVIYRMIDEWDNDVPYDFKNILFVDMEKSKIIAEANYYGNWWTGELVRNNILDKHIGQNSFRYAWVLTNVSGPWSNGVWYTDSNSIQSVDTIFYEYDDVEFNVSETIRITNLILGQAQYTFGSALSPDNELSEFVDYSIYTKNCYNNIIKPMFTEIGGQELNNILFDTNCYSNTFGNNCYSNSLGMFCNNNSFDTNCYSNTFGNNCYSNSLGMFCNNNSFGANCCSNTFGNNCRDNRLNSGYSNTFGVGCSDNRLNEYNYYNSFGNYCYSNSLGRSYKNNSFGNGCINNSFKNSSGEVVDYVSDNSFGNGCSSVILQNDETSDSQPIQNYRIANGMNGTVEVTRGLAYETTIAKNSKGEIKVYCEADLIA